MEDALLETMAGGAYPTAVAVARVIGVTPQSTGRALRNMRNKELVDKSGAGWGLTAAGRAEAPLAAARNVLRRAGRVS